jgi:hypothetical protein
MSREDGLAAGVNTRFSSKNQPENRGRKPSKLKKFCKDNGISNSDVDKVFKNLIFGSTIEQLKDMIQPGKKEKLPVIIVLLISAFIQDMNKGTLKEANTVLDRILGKPTQQITAEVSVKSALEDWSRILDDVETGSGPAD